MYTLVMMLDMNVFLYQAKGTIPQGATIVKLVTTQPNTSGAKPGTAVLTSTANSNQSILGLSPQVRIFQPSFDLKFG